jgi:hypothetical protein
MTTEPLRRTQMTVVERMRPARFASDEGAAGLDPDTETCTDALETGELLLLELSLCGVFETKNRSFLRLFYA